MSDDKRIETLLGRWKSDFRPDDGLAGRVRAEAERRSIAATRPIGWLSGAWSRPALAAGVAVALLAAGFGLGRLSQSTDSPVEEAELTVTYQLSIDPLYRLQAVAGVDEKESGQLSLRGQRSLAGPAVSSLGLNWLQGELGLSERQYRKVSSLHADYERSFDDLFIQLLESYRAYRELDRKRMSDDVIDYFELYELLQTQKRLSERSAQLTEELLGKVADVIDPQQRSRYRELIARMYPDFGQGEAAPSDA